MKNNLFLTTALVASAFVASNAMAGVVTVDTDVATGISGQTDTVSVYSNNATVNPIAGPHPTITVSSGLEFKNNTTSNFGGVFTNFHGNTLNIGNNVLFEGNKATDGGAIFSEGAKKNAGKAAIDDQYVRSTLSVGNKVSFIGNEATSGANSAGGAVVILGNNSASFGSNTTFEGNSADLGGALYAGTWGTAGDDAFGGDVNVTFGDGASFKNNTAGTKGGAIVNSAGSEITFGSVTFEGNKANGELNDIHNRGTINFNGDVTLDGGITGETGSVTFKAGKTVTVKAGETTIDNKVTTNGANLNLTFDNGFTGTYTFVEDGTTNLDHEFKLVDNTLYNISKTDIKGKYEISKKDASEVAAETGASQNEAAAVTAITSGESNNATMNAIANTISDLMQSGGAAGIQMALEAAETLAPDVAPVVAQSASENANQIFSAVSTRMSGGAATPSTKGMSSGDYLCDDGAVWVQGLHNHAKLDDRHNARGYKSDSDGIAFGFEKQIDAAVKAGIGYAFTRTDIDGHNRSLDVDTHTALIYGEYKPTAWFINAVASYSWSAYDEEKNVLGHKITGDYDAESYALQAMTGYDIAYGNTIFTPEAGLRYINVSQDGYKDTTGQYTYGSDVDTLTGIAGIRAEQAYELDNGWILRPQARVAYTYDIANDEGNAAVALANGSVYTTTGEPLKRSGFEADLGLAADISENASVSLGYQGKFRNHYEDHTGLLNFKYDF